MARESLSRWDTVRSIPKILAPACPSTRVSARNALLHTHPVRASDEDVADRDRDRGPGALRERRRGHAGTAHPTGLPRPVPTGPPDAGGEDVPAADASAAGLPAAAVYREDA